MHRRSLSTRTHLILIAPVFAFLVFAGLSLGESWGTYKSATAFKNKVAQSANRDLDLLKKSEEIEKDAFTTFWLVVGACAVSCTLIGLGSFARIRRLRGEWTASVRLVHQGTADLSLRVTHIRQIGEKLTERALAGLAKCNDVSSLSTSLQNHFSEVTPLAAEAATTVAESNQISDGGMADVSQLNATLAELNQTVKKIAEAVNAVDEIAFQTNLLALNAAVEAARAGEHGRGFGVVAQNVRELAHKSAGAAKEIADLIEVSTTLSKKGAALADRNHAVFGSLTSSVSKTARLIDDVLSGLKKEGSTFNRSASTLTEVAATQREIAAQSQSSLRSIFEMGVITDHLRFSGEMLRCELEGGDPRDHFQAEHPVLGEGGEDAPAENIENLRPRARRTTALSRVPHPRRNSVHRDE